jgi:hypothetical protein
VEWDEKGRAISDELTLYCARGHATAVSKLRQAMSGEVLSWEPVYDPISQRLSEGGLQSGATPEV